MKGNFGKAKSAAAEEDKEPGISSKLLNMKVKLTLFQIRLIDHAKSDR